MNNVGNNNEIVFNVIITGKKGNYRRSGRSKTIRTNNTSSSKLIKLIKERCNQNIISSIQFI